MRNLRLLVVLFSLCPLLHSQAVPVSGKGPDTTTGMVTTAELHGVLLDNDTDKPRRLGELSLVQLELQKALGAKEMVSLLKRKDFPWGRYLFTNGLWTLSVTPVRKKGKWGGFAVFEGTDKMGAFRFTGLEDGHYALMLSDPGTGQWIRLIHREKLAADNTAPVAAFEVKDGKSVDLGTVYAIKGYTQSEFRDHAFGQGIVLCKEQCSFFEVKKDPATGTDEIYVFETRKKK